MHFMRCHLTVMVLLLTAGLGTAQSISITGVPHPGSVGQITGTVSGMDHLTHQVAAYLFVEGGGWWTKPTFGMPTVPIHADGSFSVDISDGGLDELASMYSVSVVPLGVVPPQMAGSDILNLGSQSLAAHYRQRFGTNLEFAGRTWGVKEATLPVGPGGNRFSASPHDVWVDDDGLHLTIQNQGGPWYSTEVVLLENNGYGTYVFQTTSRQDILDAHATFGAFTWDPFGDDLRLPAWPHREIDFEDTRWGDPADTTNSQSVVQPYFVPGALDRITLPDLSDDAALTRFFTWSPGQVEFFTLRGHHDPGDFPPTAVIDHYIFSEDLPEGRVVPEPGRENLRFNLWLNDAAPHGNQPIEIVVNDFRFIALRPGDFNKDGTYNCLDVDQLVGEIASASHAIDFDLTGDGSVDAADLTAWLAAAGAANLTSGNPLPIGDANLDGDVDGQDFAIWNAHKFTAAAAWCSADFSADGFIDGQDLLLWNAHKFTSASAAPAVPEPVASWLWLVSLILLELARHGHEGGPCRIALQTLPKSPTLSRPTQLRRDRIRLSHKDLAVLSHWKVALSS